MKIAIISMIREPWGGSEELWAAMAAKALQQGHTVAHSTYRFSQVADKEQRLIEKGLLLMPRRGFIKPGTPILIRWMIKAWHLLLNKLANPFSRIFALQPDLVLYNGTATSMAKEKELISILHKKRTPYGIIVQLSNDYHREVNDREAAVLSRCYAQSVKNFFVSRRSVQLTERHLAAAVPNAQVVRNPVNLNDLSLVPYPAATTEFQLALVGNLLTVHKGQDLVLEALAGQAWKNRNWHLNIYGQGPDEPYLKQLVNFYELQQRVTFFGKVKDIRQLWAGNQILLMPSLMEGMPLAVVEAMICARPCVVTDVGGHTEWIEEGVEGFIAAAPSVPSFSEAMERAWLAKEHWQQMGLQARRKALDLYGEDPAQIFFDSIQQLVNKNN